MLYHNSDYTKIVKLRKFNKSLLIKFSPYRYSDLSDRHVCSLGTIYYINLTNYNTAIYWFKSQLHLFKEEYYFPMVIYIYIYVCMHIYVQKYISLFQTQ